MKIFITGGSGFIGSNLVDRLLAAGHAVSAYDNFSTGQKMFLEKASKLAAFALIEGDVLDLNKLTAAMAGCEFVFHLAANADVRFGTEHPRKDLEQNTIATYNVLEAMRANQICRIAFSSTGSIYGEADVFPTPECAPFPIQTSLYGASKLAAEGLIQAYCEGFGFQGYIFRFVSILGERYTHGHVFDFVKNLRSDPSRLHVLGNGRQRKSYLYVQDCIDAMLQAIERAQGKINIFNLGTDEYHGKFVLSRNGMWAAKNRGLSRSTQHKRMAILQLSQSAARKSSILCSLLIAQNELHHKRGDEMFWISQKTRIIVEYLLGSKRPTSRYPFSLRRSPHSNSEWGRRMSFSSFADNQRPGVY
jgi:UDP-glucose 4-epimerase